MEQLKGNVSFDFSGKHFVVTGASSGMGRQVAKELALAGADVLVLARRMQELKTLNEQFPERITIACVDITDYDNVEKHVASFMQSKGALDGSVHAAGVLAFTPLRAFSEIQAKQMMDVSFWAGINLMRVLTKKKYAAASTAHILFSSVSAQKGQKGLSAYAAAKAAVQVGVRSLAKEVAERGHRINTISPGWVRTEMTRETLDSEQIATEHLLGIGNPEDVSGMVLFLLSDRAKWITGADFVVDGGYLV